MLYELIIEAKAKSTNYRHLLTLMRSLKVGPTAKSPYNRA